MRIATSVTAFVTVAGWSGAAVADLAPTMIHVHDDAGCKFELIGAVAVVMTGTDRFVNRTVEDVLAIKPTEQDVKVIYPAEAYFGKLREDVGGAPVEFKRAESAQTGWQPG